MPKLPVLTPQAILKILMKNGFRIDRIKGSHHMMINDENNIRLVIPMHKRDLPKGTLYEIIKLSGIPPEEFK
jgi:predicted RNA binding protein YcfA (HicA-like mRNA interferase family)